MKSIVQNKREFLTNCLFFPLFGFQKFWDGLVRRAECRKNSEVPPTKGKHWKAKQQGQRSSTTKVDDDGNDESCVSVDDQNTAAAVDCRLKFVTQFVDTTTDLQDLLRTHFDDGHSTSSRMGVIGLHTCGNLAPNSLRVFLANPDIR